MHDGIQAVQIPKGLSTEVDGMAPRDADLLRRFADARDPQAFETLVRRHGPMVQGVCRRVLGNVHDAEDAFQAAFLVLARKAALLQNPDRLVNWLYGVAFRVARKARQKALLRDARDRLSQDMSIPGELLDLEWQELRSVLDDELNRLPEKYRAPLVLCYLCGKTNAEAAEQLGWPGGSISARLAKAREALRRRLNRRGLSLSAGLLALLLANKGMAGAVSMEVIQATASLAVQYASHPAAAGVVSAEVKHLVGQTLSERASSLLKLSAALLIAALLAVFVLPVVRESLGQSSPEQRNGRGFHPAIPSVSPDPDAFPCRVPQGGCCHGEAAVPPAGEAAAP
ncbi:MAG TPA: sigma-70 family RNA polymerase sigma factor [Planctomycetaceae bacterium]|nr:sigma-70 family RNA polymerase sigma factor [Planctomycetaceae bacterium]